MKVAQYSMLQVEFDTIVKILQSVMSLGAPREEAE